MKQRILFLNL